MGACASCLKSRKPLESGETTPLLSSIHDPSPTPYTLDRDSISKHHQDLSRIVQATQDHLIDITTCGLPDLEQTSEPVDELKQQLEQAKSQDLFKWPTVDDLTNDEEQLVSKYVDEAKERKAPEITCDGPLVVEL